MIPFPIKKILHYFMAKLENYIKFILFLWYYINVYGVLPPTYIRNKAGEAMNLLIHKMCCGITWFFKKLGHIIVHVLKKCFNRKEFFTLMFVPHTPLKKVKSVKFPRWIVSSFVLLIMAAVGVLCVFGVSYHTLNQNLDNKKSEYQALQNAKTDQDKQMDEYKTNEQQMKDQMQKLKDLEDKLNELIKSKGEQPQSNNTAAPMLASRSAGYERAQVLLDREIETQTVEDLLNSAANLENDVNTKISELDEAIKKEQERILALRAIPSAFPVSGNISSYFGYRRNPFGSGYEFHDGVDIANSRGTPIKAAGDGTVIFAGWDNGGFGYLVKISHGNGYISFYGHNSKIAVKVGQTVERGQTISYMGSTGRSTGNHCHFEITYYGKLINPFSIKQ